MANCSLLPLLLLHPKTKRVLSRFALKGWAELADALSETRTGP